MLFDNLRTQPASITGHKTRPDSSVIQRVATAQKPHESPYRFWESLDDYLKSIGYVRLSMSNNYGPECNYLASGPSSRGCSHMVVMYEGKLAHDPHPSREGLLKVDVVHMIVPILNPVKPD